MEMRSGWGHTKLRPGTPQPSFGGLLLSLFPLPPPPRLVVPRVQCPHLLQRLAV